MKSILIVDDDKELAFITGEMLTNYGYQVDTVTTIDETYEILKDKQYQLILLDINLPDGNGFEVCEELRRISKVPVIFASARTSEDDKIKGLDLGGDDYLEKPYSLKELLARVNALIRRSFGSDEGEIIYTFGDVRVNVNARTVTRKGKEVKLALKEFDVLCYLCAHKSQPVTKEAILSEVWGIFSESELSTVSVHIRWLREKLEEDPSKPVHIKTVWGVGYQLI